VALTTSTASIALLAGSIGGVVAPGFATVAAARAGETLFRGSWFRAGYELFYTPIPAAEKRAVKSIVDVGADRLGDAVGGGHIFTLLSLVLPSQPLKIAFQRLHSENGRLRGTALEYLDGVLPAEIRQQIWPFLIQSDITRPSQPQDDVIANLLRSGSSPTIATS
jgi:hypothetical protein